MAQNRGESKGIDGWKEALGDPFGVYLRAGGAHELARMVLHEG